MLRAGYWRRSDIFWTVLFTCGNLNSETLRFYYPVHSIWLSYRCSCFTVQWAAIRGSRYKLLSCRPLFCHLAIPSLVFHETICGNQLLFTKYYCRTVMCVSFVRRAWLRLQLFLLLVRTGSQLWLMYTSSSLRTFWLFAAPLYNSYHQSTSMKACRQWPKFSDAKLTALSFRGALYWLIALHMVHAHSFIVIDERASWLICRGGVLRRWCSKGLVLVVSNKGSNKGSSREITLVSGVVGWKLWYAKLTRLT